MKTTLEVQFDHLEKDVDRLKTRMDKGDDRDRENETILNDMKNRLTSLRQDYNNLDKHRVTSIEANLRYVVLTIIGGVMAGVMALLFK